MNNVVYILSDNRSGSTLLDQLLGGHDRIVSLGEIHHLHAYAAQDRTRYNPTHELDCSCGAKFDQCKFWSGVQKRLGRPLSSLKLQIRIGKFLRKHPAAFRWSRKSIGKDSFDLQSATDSEYVVDSSKCPLRFRALYEYAPDRVFPIVLVRDYRGTVHSKMKRGRKLVEATQDWVNRLRQVRALTKGLNTVHVRFEDFCLDPRAEIQRICDFIGVEFSESMLSRRRYRITSAAARRSSIRRKKKSSWTRRICTLSARLNWRRCERSPARLQRSGALRKVNGHISKREMRYDLAIGPPASNAVEAGTPGLGEIVST